MGEQERSDREIYEEGRTEDYVLRQWAFWEKACLEAEGDDVEGGDPQSPF
jgi:hypothetical protein